jgi:hypothetical protein
VTSPTGAWLRSPIEASTIGVSAECRFRVKAEAHWDNQPESPLVRKASSHRLSFQTELEEAMPNAAQPQTIAQHLAEPLIVGEPDIADPLTVFPIFGPEPRRDYRTYLDASAHGVEIRELPGGASVNDLVVHNPTQYDVLLFEGEEVLGAQQNRSLDVTALVAAGGKATVPVSCVEAGRWDGTRHRESMRPAPQTTNPRLRKLKATRARESVLAGAQARADQSEVWAEVDQLAADYDAQSAAPTHASHDVYESRRGSLDAICADVPLHEGQLGAIAAYGGELQILDLVSRPDAYRTLHRRLVQGYALEALGESVNAPGTPETSAARGFALLVSDSAFAHRERGVGLGENVRFAANGVAGSGLVADGELIQLTAFPGADRESHRVVARGRIQRPSRRR